VTSLPTGTLEPLLTKTLGDLDPNLTIISIRTIAAGSRSFIRSGTRRRQPRRSFRHCRSSARCYRTLRRHRLHRRATHPTKSVFAWPSGADRSNVIQLILRGAFKRVLIGLLLGLPLAVGAGRLISSQLYGGFLLDPLALTIAAGALAVCSFSPP